MLFYVVVSFAVVVSFFVVASYLTVFCVVHIVDIFVVNSVISIAYKILIYSTYLNFIQKTGSKANDITMSRKLQEL